MSVPANIKQRRVLGRLGGVASKAAVPVVLIAAIAAAIVWWPSGREVGELSAGIWTCSMHPQVRLPRPGKCPICGMTLIPLDEAREQMGASPGIDVEPVVRRELARELRTVGRIDYNEARVEEITARIAGRVDRLYVDFTGVRVEKGDHLVELYSPDLYSAQQELLTAVESSRPRAGSDGPADRFSVQLLRSAREKLRLWGLTPEQIAEVEKSREPKTHLTIYSPLAGTVIEKNIRLGQYIAEGDLLYRIADLDIMWLYLELYESDVGWVRYGQHADVTLEAYPGETFHGTVVFIDPFLNEETRTVRVRVNLPNPDGRLKAGMYATATVRAALLADGGPAPTGLEGKFFCPMHPEVVSDTPGTCRICGMELVAIPDRPITSQTVSDVDSAEAADKKSERTAEEGKRLPLAIRASAVLDTGRRQIAYRQTQKGYELVELTLGPRAVATSAAESGTFYPVLAGLKEGDKIVVRGGFLLDSQTQIEGRPSLLYPEGRSTANLHSGHVMPSSPAQGSDAASGAAAGAAGHQH